jgi:hypothetical protein
MRKKGLRVDRSRTWVKFCAAYRAGLSGEWGRREGGEESGLQEPDPHPPPNRLHQESMKCNGNEPRAPPGGLFWFLVVLEGFVGNFFFYVFFDFFLWW